MKRVAVGTWKVELAPEAREGLASKEDFNKVALRKSESLSHPNKHRPFTDVMLIHVKGFIGFNSYFMLIL